MVIKTQSVICQDGQEPDIPLGRYLRWRCSPSISPPLTNRWSYLKSDCGYTLSYLFTTMENDTAFANSASKIGISYGVGQK